MDDLKIVHRNPQTGELTIKVGNPPQFAKGVEKLVQTWVLTLLNEIGRDVDDPNDGGNLPALVGRSFDPNDPTAIMADVTDSIEKTNEEVIRYQMDLVNEDATALLREGRLLNIEPGASIDSLRVLVRLVSEAGSTADIVL